MGRGGRGWGRVTLDVPDPRVCNLPEPPRQLRPFGLFLVLEKNESPLPILRQYPVQPQRQVGFRVIGTAQAQVPPGRSADDLLCRLLVGIRGAEAAAVLTEELQDIFPEPRLAAKLEGAGHVFRNKGEKLFQYLPVRPETPGELEQGRPHTLIQDRQRLEKVFGLFVDVFQQLHMRYDLGRLEREGKIVRDLLRPARKARNCGHVIESIIDLDRVEALPVEVEHVMGRDLFRVEDPLPLLVPVPACPDMYFHVLAPYKVFISVFSRTTSRGSLSSRSRRNDGCLMTPSAVQPWKTTSQTSSGLTQVTDGPVSGLVLKGHSSWISGSSFSLISCSSFAPKPPPA